MPVSSSSPPRVPLALVGGTTIPPDAPTPAVVSRPALPAGWFDAPVGYLGDDPHAPRLPRASCRHAAEGQAEGPVEIDGGEAAGEPMGLRDA